MGISYFLPSERKKQNPNNLCPRTTKLTHAGWGGTEDGRLSLLKTVLIAFLFIKVIRTLRRKL